MALARWCGLNLRPAASGTWCGSGSSYCSQSDLALTFGLGADSAATVEVDWPSGTKQRFPNIPANQRLIVDESRGITPAK